MGLSDEERRMLAALEAQLSVTTAAPRAAREGCRQGRVGLLVAVVGLLGMFAAPWSMPVAVVAALAAIAGVAFALHRCLPSTPTPRSGL